jgi:hypothetical protein
MMLVIIENIGEQSELHARKTLASVLENQGQETIGRLSDLEILRICTSKA